MASSASLSTPSNIFWMIAGIETSVNVAPTSTPAISEKATGTPRLAIEVIIRCVVLGVAICLVYFGDINFLRGFGSVRLPSGTPIAYLYVIIPLSGALIALFTVEQLVNGIRNGFDHPEPAFEDDHAILPIETGAAP